MLNMTKKSLAMRVGITIGAAAVSYALFEGVARVTGLPSPAFGPLLIATLVVMLAS